MTSVLVYVVDWLPPDFGAVGQYGLANARAAARAGRDTTLIGLTSGPSGRTVEHFEGGATLTIIRLHAPPAEKGSYLRRLLWALMADLRLVWTAARTPCPRGSELLFTGSPPFMLFFAIWLKALRGFRLTYRITDFYPEVIIAALGKTPAPLALLQRLAWWARRRIDLFQALGEDQQRLLVEGGVRPERIVIVRDRSPVTFSPETRPAQRPAEGGERRLLLYSGNYGVAHDVDTVLAGLAALHQDGDDQWALWLNAVGAGADRLAAGLQSASAPCVRTQPVPLADLAGLLMSPDAHLITLLPPFAGLVLPSKVYGCLDTGKPIIFVGPQSSDVDLLCKRADGLWYRRVEPGRPEELKAALQELAADLRAPNAVCVSA